MENRTKMHVKLTDNNIQQEKPS